MTWNSDQKKRAFSHLFQNLLKRSGKTEKQLASLLDVDQTTINRWKTLHVKPGRDKFLELLKNVFTLNYDNVDAMLWLAGLPEMTRTEVAAVFGTKDTFQTRTESQLRDRARKLLMELIELDGENLGLSTSEFASENLMPRGLRAPNPMSRIYGRDEVISHVMEKLKDPAGTSIVALCGFPGSGKTKVAEAVRYKLLEDENPQFEDVLWVSYKDEEFVPMTLKSRGAETNVSADKSPDFLTELARQNACEPDELRRKLAGTKCLIVVDNLETAPSIGKVLGELRSLLAAGNKALITSRLRMEVPDVELVPVFGLDAGPALNLLRNEGGRRGVEELVHANDDSLKRLHVVTSGLPLALHWAIGHARNLGLDRAISDLESVKGGVEELYDFLLGESWSRLSAESKQMLVFTAACTSAYTWVNVDREDIEKVAPLSSDGLDRAVTELTHWHLLDTKHGTAYGQSMFDAHEAQLFALHPLVRHFVIDHSVGATGREQPGFLERAIASRLAQLRSYVHDKDFDPYGERFRNLGLENALETMKRSLLSGLYWQTLEFWWHLEYLVDVGLSFQCCTGEVMYPLALRACENILEHSVEGNEKYLAKQLKGLVLHAWGVYASSFDWPSPKEGPERLNQAQAVFTESQNLSQLTSVIVDTAYFAARNSDSRLVSNLRSRVLELVNLYGPEGQRRYEFDIPSEFGARVGIALEPLPFVRSPSEPTEETDWVALVDQAIASGGGIKT